MGADVDYIAILSTALEDLEAAVDKLEKDTIPYTPIPRIRKFEIVPRKMTWPYKKDLRSFLTEAHVYGLERWKRKNVSTIIIALCRAQPRLILRALRRIQAATAWCEARAEGRRRAAEEILRQQARAVEALEAEAAMLALK